MRESGYVTDTLAQGPSKFMGVCRLPDGMHRRLDLRSVPPEQFHFATLYFTGSNLLNVKMRLRAIELGMTLNEYRLERKPAVDGQEGEAVPAGRSERFSRHSEWTPSSHTSGAEYSPSLVGVLERDKKK